MCMWWKKKRYVLDRVFQNVWAKKPFFINNYFFKVQQNSFSYYSMYLAEHLKGQLYLVWTFVYVIKVIAHFLQWFMGIPNIVQKIHIMLMRITLILSKYFLSSTLITHIDHHFYCLHLNRFTDLPEYLYNVVYTRSLMICDGLCVLNNEFCSLIAKHFLSHALTPLLNFYLFYILQFCATQHIYIYL